MNTKERLDIDMVVDIKKPKRYKVVLLNDDYTTFEFVIEVLVNIFNKTYDDATKLTYIIHEKGKAICGVYSYEVAITKIKQVELNARNAGYPLKAVLEDE